MGEQSRQEERDRTERGQRRTPGKNDATGAIREARDEKSGSMPLAEDTGRRKGSFSLSAVPEKNKSPMKAAHKKGREAALIMHNANKRQRGVQRTQRRVPSATPGKTLTPPEIATPPHA
ncbi:hypothetical protein MRX96_013672 [Rhipicephalus microplus]